MWYSRLLGIDVEPADVLMDDAQADLCPERAGTELCLRQRDHVGGHLASLHVDPLGHRWLLLPTFDIPRSAKS